MEQIERNKTMSPSTASKSTESLGVLEAFFDGSLNTAEAMVTGCVDVLEETRTQISQRVAQTLDWAEGFPRGFFSFARRINESTDRLAAQTIRSGDRTAHSVLGALRRLGDGARGFASDTASSIVGNGSRRTPAASVAAPL